MATIISSQSYIDDDIVDTKIANNDYIVYLSPVFTVEEEDYQVIMDGHHSYHASIKSGNAPVFVVQSAQDNDRIALIDNVDLFLEACYLDTDWYDVATGKRVF